jgi:hypothetical protein
LINGDGYKQSGIINGWVYKPKNMYAWNITCI